jgi:hypothetical protein
MLTALFCRAFEGKPLVKNGLFHAMFETLLVENMAASKDTYVFVVYFNHTYGTFCQLAVVSYQ